MVDVGLEFLTALLEEGFVVSLELQGTVLDL